MKKALLLAALGIMGFMVSWGQVTIGTNNPPDPSAVLDLQSSNKGFLVPRLTTSQRNAIVNPAIGLEIYNTTTNCLQVYLPQSTWKDVVCDCQAPSSAFTFPNQIGPNAPASFSASTPGMTYNWTFQSGSPGTSTQQTVNVTWANPGTYTVTLTVTDNSGCSSTTTLSITVSNCPPPGGNNMTFAYTGSMQSWTVPNCVTSIDIQAFGAQGEGVIENYIPQTGGLGGLATGTLAVSPGQVLYFYVGGQGGWNGGGAPGTGTPTDGIGGPAGYGGGASDVRVGGQALSDRVIVGGGGGGAGRDYVNGSCQPCGVGGNGGAGGGTTGTNGQDGQSVSYPNPGSGGGGGSQIAGGAAGNSVGAPSNRQGLPGALGIGGAGASGTQSIASGGGGGGYYGGGSGASASDGSGRAGGGGGGGSSYTGGVTNGSTTPGVRSGNGQIIITY